MRFAEQVFNPFEMFVEGKKKKKDGKKSKATGEFNYHNERICIQCDEETATRLCLMCEDAVFCTSCYVSAHIIGPKKRHFYFDITYDPNKPESASTWAQPNLMDAVPLRDISFAEEESETSSDESFARYQGYSAHEASHRLNYSRKLPVGGGIPYLHMNAGSSGFASRLGLFGR